MFIAASQELTIDIFIELNTFLSQNLTSVVSGIAEYCYKLQLAAPTTMSETTPRFIYFNKFNLAYKSSVHLDNKQCGNITCTKDSLKLMADMNGRKSYLGNSGETIMKTMNDYWVVGKTSNCREFYVALQQKNASLIDISGKYLNSLNLNILFVYIHCVSY